jgi:hypothetical protein
LHLASRPFAESILVRVGDAFQTQTDWHLQRPPAVALAAN